MSIDTATELQHAVEDAAAHLYVWALKDIPQDLRDALVEARERETSVPGRRVLDIIIRNVQDVPVGDDRPPALWPALRSGIVARCACPQMRIAYPVAD